jgi:hypothetical protein
MVGNNTFMIVHCTQKLSAKLTEVSATPLAETSPLGSWHAHLYNYGRRQCVMFCHDESRYVLFLPGLVKSHFTDLGRLHRELFRASLVAQGVNEMLLARVALALGPVQFDLNTDRSVLGSMRVADIDLSWLMQDVVDVMESDHLVSSLRINERPLTVRGRWIWAKEEMLSLIARLSGTVAG